MPSDGPKIRHLTWTGFFFHQAIPHVNLQEALESKQFPEVGRAFQPTIFFGYFSTSPDVSMLETLSP